MSQTATQKKNVPALRFPEFSGDWNEERFENSTLSIKSGGSSYFKSGVFPVYGSTGQIGYSDKYEYEQPTILVARVGANAGRINRAEGKYGVTDNTLVIILNERNDFEFSIALLEKTNLNRFVFGSGQPLITGTMLKRVKCTIPALPEQKKIASFLSVIDKKIEMLEQKKNLLDQYKKGMMQKLFSQELRFKDKDGKNFPDWEEKRLGDVTDINPRSSNLPDEFYYIDLDKVADGFLKTPNLIRGHDAPSRAQRLLQQQDILYQLVRPYQRNNYFFDLTGDYVASTGYAQIRYSQCPQFIFQLLHTDLFVGKVLKRSTGTNYPAINSNALAGIKIKIPSDIKEQQKIANALSAIDKKIYLVTSEFVHAKAFKKGLLQQMFV